MASVRPSNVTTQTTSEEDATSQASVSQTLPPHDSGTGERSEREGDDGVVPASMPSAEKGVGPSVKSI